MGLIKKFIINYFLVLIVIYIPTVLINYFYWNNQGPLRDTDLFGLLTFTFLAMAIYALIFTIIHAIVSILYKEIFNIVTNKVLLLVSLIFVLIVEIFYFPWWGLIKDGLYSAYFNYFLLCIVFLLIYIGIKKYYSTATAKNM